jgi:hypothetical protein
MLSTVNQGPREVLNICRCMSSHPSPATVGEYFKTPLVGTDPVKHIEIENACDHMDLSNNRSSAVHEVRLGCKRRQRRLEESWKQLSMM